MYGQHNIKKAIHAYVVMFWDVVQIPVPQTHTSNKTCRRVKKKQDVVEHITLERCDLPSYRTSSKTITVVLFIPVHLRRCSLCTGLLIGDIWLACCPSDPERNVTPQYGISLRAKTIAVNTCHFITARHEVLAAVLNTTCPSQCRY